MSLDKVSAILASLTARQREVIRKIFSTRNLHSQDLDDVREILCAFSSVPSTLMKEAVQETFLPLTLLIDPGTAAADDLAEFLAGISNLYRMMGGSGVTFRLIDVRELAEVLV
jgi:hypothetical protein